VAKLSKMNIFVSDEEASLFANLVDIEANKIDYVNNGVDTEYFANTECFNSPFINSEKIIVFTGAMDYWANVDAVVWFVKEVFPKIKQQCKFAQFFIVGSKPCKEVLDLAAVEGVYVTGSVKDIRPYLFYAQLVVAPLRIARGIQNKVLEAMAMGKRIVATPQAIEGISVGEQELCVTEQPADFAQYVLTYLADISGQHYVQKNRNFVAENYSWGVSHQRLTRIIDCE